MEVIIRKTGKLPIECKKNNSKPTNQNILMPTPREIVHQTLNFENPIRAPRDMWDLPLNKWKYPEVFEELERDFPKDMFTVDPQFKTPLKTKGDPYEIGQFTDTWGCVFENINRGLIGEVKNPPVKDWSTDLGKIRIPTEWLTIDRDAVNRQCAGTDRFVIYGHAPRPFEQLQFIRGTADLYMDLMDPCDELIDFMKKMHDFHCEYISLWAKTDVDGVFFFDDWGSQISLLVSPALWRRYFKPMYRDFVQIAHSAGKKVFMHSDGYILDILPELIEVGVDAINSQIFCMPFEKLEQFAGKITFWGEIDRQNLLVNGTKEQIDEAVRKVHKHLWKKGGCFAHCSFDAGSKPENVRQVYESWESIFAAKGSIINHG